MFQFISIIEKQISYIQKKPTFYPKWNTCFDCHLYQGRLILIIVKDSETNKELAESTVSAESLANRAKDRVFHQDWVTEI